ncbi:MAG: hypothetical protein PHS14_07035 [Elusimicrobia bacterium]|nr:hypothetical protein [Elusimicrobiota bacterium]
MILVLALLTASFAAAEKISPFAAIDSAWLAKGFTARERASGSSGDLSASAVVYTPSAGGGDRLEVYVVAHDKAYLGFTHPSAAERLELDPSPAGRFADMFRDGSLTLAYRATRPSLGATELNVLRWKRFKIERVAVFPEGRFLRLESGPVVAARELPLGRYLSMGCEDFGTISRTAFRTVLHAPRGGGFVDASAEHPEYFKSEISRKEKAMARLKGELEKNAGEYLGLAISTYYDYAALGRAREGWTRLREFFTIPALAPASVKTCMTSMEKDLRGKLGVPAGWP